MEPADTDTLEQARRALAQGDVALAGALARQVADDPHRPAAERDQAREIARGIGIDPVTLAAAALAVLVLAWVASSVLGH